MTVSLRNVLDEVTILDSHEVGKDLFETCASTQAGFDESTGEMHLQLDSFVRKVIHSGKDQILHPPWLPKRDRITTHLDFTEATDAAKEISRSWINKVRQAVPPSSQWVKEATWLKPVQGLS